MVRRRLIAGLVPLFFSAVLGCGGGTAEDPRVQNSTVKMTPVQLKTGKPGDKGSSIVAE